MNPAPHRPPPVRQSALRGCALGLLYALGGYLLGALAGYVLIVQFAANTHDRALEAAMTGAFVTGPLGAIVAFIAGFRRAPGVHPPD